ncbi:hypothetical protein [Listeria monocytogenes]|nr:hypothetical protein [Listeria monocytogenes]
MKMVQIVLFNFITSLEFIPDIETVELFFTVISTFLALLIIMG